MSHDDDTEDDEPAPDTSPWLICPTCHGDGHHCQHLGAITEEDRERDWDADSWEDYMNGLYDKTCETCGGSGKVRTDTLNRILEEAAEYRSERHHGDY